MTLNGLEGQAHLHIVFDVHIVEAEEEIPQGGVFPTLTTSNEVVIDRFHFLRYEATADSLDDELVVVFGVETHIDVVLGNALFQLLVVVVDDGVLAGLCVLEDHKPVFAEDLHIVDNQSHWFTSYSTK